MAKHDIYHDLVKSALELEGWKITHDPFIIQKSLKRVNVQLIVYDIETEKIAQWIS